MPTLRDGVLIWGSEIDEKAILQAGEAARLPFMGGHVALMPDAHVGMGATIGSVLPTQGAIIPSAVGTDIGCGVDAARTELTAEDLPDDLSRLFSGIASKVPAGVGKGHASPKGGLANAILDFSKLATDLTVKQRETAVAQFGTLGSGNHFVEVCLDENDKVWVVLHSGSRGIGNQLAQRHIEKAKGLMKQYFVKLEDPDLAYFVEGTPEFDSYITDVLWAQHYAFQSRGTMLASVVDELRKVVGLDTLATRTISCHHNYTEREHHHGKDLWITRKGAIRAREGDLGIIPGSMGTSSYIVRGLGNPASYFSCSHGAGRRMSRSKAKELLSVDTLKAQMRNRMWNSDHAEALLDEHPDSYKDIDQVMGDQKDLVQIEHTLRQILNYKGF